jgi:hypothetical protein
VNSRQTRLATSIRDVAELLKDRRFHTSTISPLRGELAEVLASIRSLLSTQQVSSAMLGGDRRSVMHLKSTLRTRHLLPITRRGRLVLKGYPGIEESLRLPHARADVKTHVAATRRIVKTLRPHSAAMIDAGFHKGFLTECERAARAMAERNDSPDTNRNRRSLATRSLAEAIRKGRDIIDVIDSHVNAELAHDNLLLGRWRYAKRVPGRMGRPRKRRGGVSADVR